jgi:hypothetical protein
MSLKALHIVFITASILLTLGWGGWSLKQYAVDHETGQLLLGLGAIAVGMLLAIYGRAVLRKLSEIDWI